MFSRAGPKSGVFHKQEGLDMGSPYSEKLKHPKWQKRRLEILNRDGFKCRLCDETEETLHVHHIRYERGREPWEHGDESLVTVCVNCHDELHAWNFGPWFIETMIGAGAGMMDILEVLCAIKSPVEDSTAMTRKEWTLFCQALPLLVLEIKAGRDAWDIFPGRDK